MKSKITLVITSFNRPDLLDKTINSAIWYSDDLFDEIIIIEDSADKTMRDYLLEHYSHFHLIIHDKTMGAYESIDEAYSHVKTPFVFHCEDDWEFYKSGFIERSIDVLEGNPMIMQVNLSNGNNQPIIYNSDYSVFGSDGVWNGFTCNPSIRSMAAYEKTKPWTQWIDKTKDLAIQEYMVGRKYFELGYKAAYLNESFCKHTGIKRCTWHK